MMSALAPGLTHTVTQQDEMRGGHRDALGLTIFEIQFAHIVSIAVSCEKRQRDQYGKFRFN